MEPHVLTYHLSRCAQKFLQGLLVPISLAHMEQRQRINPRQVSRTLQEIDTQSACIVLKQISHLTIK